VNRALVLAALSLTAASARADAPPPPKRAVPDYDGRTEEPTTGRDVAAWIPRVVLFPARIVIDHGVRRPLGWTVSKAEHSRGVRRVLSRLFRYVEDANPLIFPTVLADFGLFKSSVGTRVIWRRGYLIPKSDVSLRLGTGGLDWWRAEVGTTTKVGALRAASAIGFNDRPDYVFYGIGRDAPETARARYSARRLFANAAVGGHVEKVGQAFVSAGVEDTELGSSTYDGDRSIEQQIAAGRIAPTPGGYERDYRLARIGGRVTLDSRFDGRRASSGARLDVSIERVRDIDGGGEWTRVELMVGGGLLLDRIAERKLDIRAGIELVEPGHDDPQIPFRELATVSPSWLRGLPGGRVYGASAAAVIIDYQWPLAAWLDAHAHAGAGNVFEPYLGGFALRHLRGSFGGALTIAGLTNRHLGISLAFGTEPLGAGFDVDSVRFILEYSSDY
jgi:hypothetical protein